VHLGPVWVLKDQWPTIRYLTLYWEFCSGRPWKRQYEWCIKIYMAYYEEKEKSHDDPWGLGSFYFFCVVGALYYQGGCIGWVGEVQIIKINLLTKVPRKTGHIRVSDPILEALANHVWASLYPQRLSPNRTYLAPDPGFREVSWTCPAPSPDISGLSILSWVKALEPDMSGSHVVFQRGTTRLDKRPTVEDIIWYS
jgi:hypothetical protein